MHGQLPTDTQQSQRASRGTPHNRALRITWPFGAACPRAPTRHRAGGAPRTRAVRRARHRSPRHASARHRGARRSGSVPRCTEPARGHGGSSRRGARRLTAVVLGLGRLDAPGVRSRNQLHLAQGMRRRRCGSRIRSIHSLGRRSTSSFTGTTGVRTGSSTVTAMDTWHRCRRGGRAWSARIRSRSWRQVGRGSASMI